MAKKVAVAEPVAVKKVRKAPDFSGVPGELVDVAGVEGVWGSRLKRSPYDALLLQLKSAPAGKAIKFASVKAWGSVVVRARKLGMRVEPMFQADGTLLVRMAVDPVTEDAKRKERHEAVLRALKQAPMNQYQISGWLRSNAGMDLDAAQVDAICNQESRTGWVEFKEGKWHLARK